MTLTAVLPHVDLQTEDTSTSAVRIVNTLIGLIVARHRVHRHRYQVRTADGLLLTVHDQAAQGPSNRVEIGRQVTLRIPPHAVIVSPQRPLDSTEENVWSARVVLPAGGTRGSLMIVKILGRPWTLTSTEQSGRRSRPLRTWDHITVRIRPESCVAIRRYPGDTRLRPRLLTPCPSSDPVTALRSRIDAHPIRLEQAGNRSPLFPASSLENDER